MPFTLPPGAPPSPPPSPSRADGDEAFSAKADAHAAWMMIITTWFTGFVAWLITFIGELNASFETIQNDVESASNSKLSAAESAASALESKNVSAENKDISVSSAESALESKNFAQAAASQVDVAGALAGLPPRVGNGGKWLRVKADASAIEYAPMEGVVRLHVLSVAASTKYAVGGMFPIFDKQVTGANYTASPNRLMFTGQQWILSAGDYQTYCGTSPDGEIWTLRTIGSNGSSAPWDVRNNGANVMAVYFNGSTVVARRSTDHGVTWSGDAGTLAYGFSLTFKAYSSSGVWLGASNSSLTAIMSNNNGTSFTIQTLPGVGSARNLQTVQGKLLLATNEATTNYYTSTTGLTGSWTIRALPAGILANACNIYEDGSGGLILIPTDTTKNFYHTTDGEIWVDLGFNKSSYTYGGVGSQVSTFFGIPMRINGCWLVLSHAPDNSAQGYGGAGALVKYAGATWIPVYVGVSQTLVNSGYAGGILLVATDGAGKTLIRGSSSSATVIINTNTTKCTAHFIG